MVLGFRHLRHGEAGGRKGWRAWYCIGQAAAPERFLRATLASTAAVRLASAEKESERSPRLGQTERQAGPMRGHGLPRQPKTSPPLRPNAASKI
eukprot:6744235-Pyramimonas_sp.AAC.1